MTVMRIRVDLVKDRYMAVKDYGDDLGYLEEIGLGTTPSEAITDLLEQGIVYNEEAYRP